MIMCAKSGKHGEATVFLCVVLLCAGTLYTCAKTPSSAEQNATAPAPSASSLPILEEASMKEDESLVVIRTALENAKIPADLSAAIMEAARNGSFQSELGFALEGDPYLHYLVDKAHTLPDGYAPDDLVRLTGEGKSYTINRNDLSLRRAAEESLENMAKAARADGVTLLVSSTYRSYDYQVTVYNRNVKQMGQEAADRESARPGYSQHQTGLAVDFGSIDDSFAQTKAGKWVLSNTSHFGWSLSFPDGYEALTGYRWESWHYRYVGVPLVHFIDLYFGGIQQYALQFIHEWKLISR